MKKLVDWEALSAEVTVAHLNFERRQETEIDRLFRTVDRQLAPLNPTVLESK